MSYNLHSPSNILEPCKPHELNAWFKRGLEHVPMQAERQILEYVAGALDQFIRWPNEALLLWEGCDRIPTVGRAHKYFSYPPLLKTLATERKIKLDTRPNGPAIAAFQIAGGQRPGRLGSQNSWSVHHLYSGKFPHHEQAATIHATKSGLHYTQSAGLIAAHPIADALVGEYPYFTWLLRAKAFISFGYDPDHVFSGEIDRLGFAAGTAHRVVFTST